MSAVAPLPTFAALHDIRDKAILLSLGKAFLCEEVFLMKIGHSIDESLEHLREDILSLKMRFVGKFVEEVDTDSILDDLHSQASFLQAPDRRVTDKCTVGTLGAELEEAVGVLTQAIRTIRGKVEGEIEEYTKKEAVVKGAKTAGSLVSSVVSLAIKLVVLLFLLALGPAIYLGVTMDREGSLQKQIAESKAYIQSQKAQIESLRKEREELSGRIESSQGDNLSRQQKLELMDLNVKVHGLDQSVHKAEAEITEHERVIKLNQQKIQEIAAKPFLQRFLRQ
jgi:cell division protein FtsB